MFVVRLVAVRPENELGTRDGVQAGQEKLRTAHSRIPLRRRFQLDVPNAPQRSLEEAKDKARSVQRAQKGSRRTQIEPESVG